MNETTNKHSMQAQACENTLAPHPEFPAYRALRDAWQRAMESRTDAEYAEAWAEALRLKDAGLKDEQRMRVYLAQLPEA